MHRFKNIGVILDLKRTNDDVIDHAKELVIINRAVIHFLCLLPDGISAKQKKDIEKAIQETIDFDFIIYFLTGKPVIDITHYSVDKKLDIILIEPESQENRINSFFKGSLALSLMRKTPCPVWVVKRPVTETYQRILIAVDPNEEENGTELNDKLIQIGTSYAKRQAAECYLVAAWALKSESILTGAFLNTPPAEIERLKKECKEKYTYQFKILQERNHNILDETISEMIYGEPGLGIAKFVADRKIDLILIGTIARAGLQGFVIGNTAEKIVNQVDCSIMAVKPDGFKSPILA